MKNHNKKNIGLNIWATLGAFFATVGRGIASGAKAVGRALCAFGRWFLRHWRAVAVITAVVLIAVGIFFALFLTLPVKSVEVEGEVVLLEGEAYTGGFNIKATTKLGLIHREEVRPSSLSGLDPNTPGTQIVTINYGKRRVSAMVIVLALSDVTLRVREGTMPTEYEPNDPFPTKGVFDLYYNGEIIRSAPITKDQAPGFTTRLSMDYDTHLVYRDGLRIPYHYKVLEVIESITASGRLYAEQGVALSKTTAIGGAKFLVKYKDGTEREVMIYDDELLVKEGRLEVQDSPYTTTITLIYKGVEVECPVYAYPEGQLLTVTSMVLHLDKKVYMVGESYDYSSGYIEVEYENFEGKALLRTTRDMIPDTVFTEAKLSVVVTAEYMGKQASENVRVVTEEDAGRVTDMMTAWRGRHDGPPLKGQELEFVDATIDVEYGFGYRTEPVPLTAEMVSGYDKSIPGDQGVTVTYGDFAKVFTIRVGDPDSTEVTYVFAVVGWNDPTYYSSDELVIPEGGYLDVEIGYGASRAKVPLADPEVEITGFTPHVLEEQTLIISYKGFALKQSFVVRDDRTDEVIDFWAPWSITIDKDDELDLSGECTVFYSTGRQVVMTLQEVLDAGGRISGSYDTSAVGTYPVSVYYPGFARTDHFTWIYVEGEIPVVATGLRVDVSEGKTSYAINESLSVAGMKLYVTYSNDFERDVSESLYPGIVTGFDNTFAHTGTATIIYYDEEEEKNFQATFEYTIVE